MFFYLLHEYSSAEGLSDGKRFNFWDMHCGVDYSPFEISMKKQTSSAQYEEN
jgi:hypothetical protein